MTSETKRCPMCAESIESQALICKHCGYDYRTGGRPTAGPPSASGMAVASLVLGILWICWIGSILAVVFGYTAKKQINDSGGRLGGSGLATAGIVLGWIGIGVLILNLFLGFLPFAIGSFADRSVSRAFDSISN